MFHRLMAELSKETIDATLIDSTLGLVDGLRGRLETGIEVAATTMLGGSMHDRTRMDDRNLSASAVLTSLAGG